MRYIIIRSDRTDKFTMHATTCQVAAKHYGQSLATVTADAPDTIEQCLLEMTIYAEECGWDAAPPVKICNCAK